MSKKKFFTPTYFGLLAGVVSAYFLFKKGDDIVDELLPPAFETKISLLGGTEEEREDIALRFLDNMDGVQFDVSFTDERRVATVLSDVVISTQDIKTVSGPVDMTIQASTKIL